jgi:plasmid stabilization system protein ParE
VKLRWSQNAFSDLDDIFAYISPTQSDLRSGCCKPHRRVCAFAGWISLAGRVADAGGTRRLSVVNYPYVIFYRVDEVAGEVLILSVRHTARDTFTID